MLRLRRIFRLGLKEIFSLRRDAVMLGLLLYAFSMGVVSQATGVSTSVNNASVAIVDEDRSEISRALVSAFQAPEFQRPVYIDAADADLAMDRGRYLFIVSIPPDFQADLRDRRSPEVQVLIDATAMQQAGVGAGYIGDILRDEIARAAYGRAPVDPPPIDLVLRSAYNPNKDAVQFQGMMALIGYITIMTILLTGAALMREREHGTIEHLLAMPLTPFDIAAAKIWANGAVVLTASTVSMIVVLQGVLGLEVTGSRALFLFGAMLYMFSACALGVLLATVARSMAQFALLFFLVMLPIQMLSGGETPVDGQPEWLQPLTLALPSRHFVDYSQAIVTKGAGLSAVWQGFLIVAGLGAAMLALALALFRRSISADG